MSQLVSLLFRTSASSTTGLRWHQQILLLIQTIWSRLCLAQLGVCWLQGCEPPFVDLPHSAVVLRHFARPCFLFLPLTVSFYFPCWCNVYGCECLGWYSMHYSQSRSIRSAFRTGSCLAHRCWSAICSDWSPASTVEWVWPATWVDFC